MFGFPKELVLVVDFSPGGDYEESLGRSSQGKGGGIKRLEYPGQTHFTLN